MRLPVVMLPSLNMPMVVKEESTASLRVSNSAINIVTMKHAVLHFRRPEPLPVVDSSPCMGAPHPEVTRYLDYWPPYSEFLATLGAGGKFAVGKRGTRINEASARIENIEWGWEERWIAFKRRTRPGFLPLRQCAGREHVMALVSWGVRICNSSCVAWFAPTPSSGKDADKAWLPLQYLTYTPLGIQLRTSGTGDPICI